MIRNLILSLLALVVAVPAAAGTLDDVKVALTLKGHATKTQCTTNAPSMFGCDAPGFQSNLVVDGAVGVSYDMYLVALDINPVVGLGGAALGIAYPTSLGVYSWTRCSDLEFPGQGWPASGGGNSITFNTVVNCPGQVPDPSDPQGQGAAILGWFYCYAYGPSVFEITQRNIAIPDFKVADCSASESEPLFPGYAGRVGFGQPGYQPCRQLGPSDTTPPQLVLATGSGGGSQVVVTFDEPIDAGTLLPGNFRVEPGPGGTGQYAVLGVYGSVTEATLTLDGNLEYNTTYTVIASNVADTSGNVIAPGSSASFLTGSAPPVDTTPPTLVLASGNGGTVGVQVRFSEAVGAGATDPANYELTPGPGGVGAYGILTVIANGSTVVLGIDAPLEFATTYTVTVSGVADLAGNVIAPGSTASFTTGVQGDVTAPTLVQAYGVAGGGMVTVVFSEEVLGGATATGNYTVTEFSPPGSSLILTGASLYGTAVRLQLAGVLVDGTTYQVRVSNVADLAGNIITPNSIVYFQAHGGSLVDPKVALHLKVHTTKDPCTANAPTIPCNDFTVQGNVGAAYDLYLVLADDYPAGGFSGVQCGIAYGPHLGMYSWTRCGDLEFPGQGWPASGGGNTITWVASQNCQSGYVGNYLQAVAGWFYVYAYGQEEFAVTRRNIAVPDLKVADCGGSEYNVTFPDNAARVGFGGIGYNPCLGSPAPVEKTSWGAIKRSYGGRD